MNVIKLYFFVFLAIFVVRVGLKWRDTTFLPQTPQVYINAPLADGDFGLSSEQKVQFTGTSGVRWSTISNVSLVISNSHSVYRFQSTGFETWTNLVLLGEGTNWITSEVFSWNGRSAQGGIVTVIYDPNLRTSSMTPSRPPIEAGSIASKGGVNPNVIFYIVIILMDALALIGIFGYAYKKEVFKPMFWKIFLPFFTLLETYIIASSAYVSFWVLLFAISLILPAPYTIYLYGFVHRWVEKKSGSSVTK